MSIKGVSFLFFLPFLFFSCRQVGEYSSAGGYEKWKNPYLIRGELPNGLRYFVQRTDNTTSSTELRLVVKVGPSYENSHQKEYSHLIEHLAFEGTEKMPLDSVRRFFAANGLRSGADFGASTGSFHTTYHISVPWGQSELVRKCLNVFAEWAGHAHFSREGIELQGKVVSAEIKRRSSSPRARQSQHYSEVVLGINAGSDEDIDMRLSRMNSVDQSELIDFYLDRYRPEEMALVIVGDVDAQAVVDTIKEIFSPLVPERPRNPFVADSMASYGCLAGRSRVIRSVELGTSDLEVELLYKKSSESMYLRRYADYRAFVMKKILSDLLSNRFVNRSVEGGNISAGISQNLDNSGLDVMRFSTSSLAGQELESFVRCVMSEIKSIKEEGFSKEEFELSRVRFFDSHSGKTTGEPKSLANRYVDEFVFAALSLAPDEELHILRSLIDEVTKTEVESYFNIWVSDTSNLDVLLSGSDEVIRSNSDLELKKWINGDNANFQCGSKQVTENKIDTSLFTSVECRPGRRPLIEERDWDNIGMRYIALANGAKIFVKIDTSRAVEKGNVELLVNTRVGATGVSDQLITSAVTFVSRECGYGGVQSSTINEIRDRFGVSLYPYIDSKGAWIRGECSESNLGILFSLLNRLLTRYKQDSLGIVKWKLNLLESLNSKSERAKSEMDILLGRSRPTVRVPFELSVITQDKFDSVFIENFLNPSKLVIVISQVEDYQKLEKLLLKYLSCIDINSEPGTKMLEDDVRRFFSYRRDFYFGGSTRADVHLIYPVNNCIDYSLENQLTAEVIHQILRNRIFARLRSKEGAVYTPRTMVEYERRSVDSASMKLHIIFDCEFSDVDRLISIAEDEFYDLLGGVLRKGEVEDAISVVRASYRHGGQSHLTADQIHELIRYNDRSYNILDYDNILSSLKYSDIILLMNLIKDGAVSQKVVIFPESSANTLDQY